MDEAVPGLEVRVRPLWSYLLQSAHITVVLTVCGAGVLVAAFEVMRVLVKYFGWIGAAIAVAFIVSVVLGALQLRASDREKAGRA